MYDTQGIDHSDLIDDGGTFELTYDEALAEHWDHRDEELTARAAAELELELCATVEFISWQIARIAADAEDAATVAA